MKNIAILLATYNGGQYLKEQLDSLFAQSNQNFRLVIHDDGSTDDTKHIIGEYRDKYPDRIELLYGKPNGSPMINFMYMLSEVEADYYFLCDQDDVWEVNKLERAVGRLEQMQPDQPNVYVHDFWMTDEQLHPLKKYGNCIEQYDFRMAITECLHMGFSTVFNAEFRRLMLKGDIRRIPTHDWWQELIAMEFGNLYVDDYVGAWHRRLDSSLSENNLKNRVRWFFHAWRGGSEIPALAAEFYRVFSKDMPHKDEQILALFVSEKYNLGKAIQKAFYSKRWRTSFASELVMRLLMLTGRI